MIELFHCWKKILAAGQPNNLNESIIFINTFFLFLHFEMKAYKMEYYLFLKEMGNLSIEKAPSF